MLIVSTQFKVLLLGPHSFADIFSGGELRIFGGSRPTAADNAEPSLPLAIVARVGAPTPGLQFMQSGEYVLKPPADVWQLTVLQPGTASWFRLVAAGDTGGASFSAARIDGDIGTTAAPLDMVLSNLVLTAGTALPFGNFVYTIPPLVGA